MLSARFRHVKAPVTNRMPDGGVYLQRITFEEIVPPEKLVFTWSRGHPPASGVTDESRRTRFL
jgi:uncharacterized protein YndB with AHSA1/START domain